MSTPSVRQIFENHILQGEVVTIAFPTKTAYQNFSSALHVYCRRYNRQLAMLGMETSDKLSCGIQQKLPDGTIIAKFATVKIPYIRESGPPTYKIISCENTNLSGSNSSSESEPE